MISGRENEDYDITVRFGESDRNAIPDLDKIYVFKEGRQIPLSSVTQFSLTAGYGTIRRSDLKRVVTVTGNNYGRLSNDVLNDVKAKLADYNLPPGYQISYRW